ncbi:multidrug efflux MFS transporter MdtH [Iodobacter fluviatilis]|uniref:DHA1 family multidrug resistance protein-like MFS transporter n=1 Tax=Iodobacter fluviatilis TaxID=537 RepID=A0A377Q5D5_9NEIS|nr:multidrug efflux MFS transporter MdtH [Iodobacter fluviatilis]TCU87122.1 DHA1 family multidrug resistance protein-like MFS transporter [Iodobacter fluviatilis]STQ90454.1 Multidrug resistance protein MdtH [Iodobacter fluviatilis]
MAGAERARRLGRRFIMLDNMLGVCGFFLVFPLISLHFVDQLGWAAAAVGLALGIRQLSQQGLGLLGGSLADRFGARPLIVSGMLLRAAGFAVMAMATHPSILIFSCVLSGLGGTLFDPPRSALIIKLTRPHERNRFYSLLMMQESAGAMLGALLGSWLLAFDFFWVGMGGSAVFVLVALLNAMFLPAYRVAAKRTAAITAIRVVLADKPFLFFVFTLSGYYVLCVQIMLLLPVVIKQLAGTAQAVGWMYSLDAVLALCLLYPLARLGERYFSLQVRVLAGITLMTASMAAMALVTGIVGAFVVLTFFYLGTLITEPAREALLASFAQSEARASYMGMGRMGLAVGGLFGYTGGGFLLDHARSLNMPSLPWLVLALIGSATLLGLFKQFFPSRKILSHWLKAQSA